MSSPKDCVLEFAAEKHYGTINMRVVDDDPRISLKAKGLYTALTGKGDGWEFNRAWLEGLGPDGEYAVNTGLRELKEAGYLRITRHRGDGGHFSGWTWEVSPWPIQSWSEEALEKTEAAGQEPAIDRNPNFPRFGFSDAREIGAYTSNKGTSDKGDVGGSSFHSSPPQGGEEDDRSDDTKSDDTPDPREEPLAWIEATPASENAPTAHWVDGVRELWWGEPQDPVGQGVRATMQYLETARKSYSGSHIDGSRFVVGCHLLREGGELMGLDPGEPFGRGLLLEHDKGDGRLIWYRALDAARELETPDEDETAETLEQAGLDLNGADEEVERVPA